MPEAVGIVHWGVPDIALCGLDCVLVCSTIRYRLADASHHAKHAMTSSTAGLCLRRLTDKAKGIERLAFIRIVDVLIASQIGREELSGWLDGALNNHVVDRCLGRSRCDSVD